MLPTYEAILQPDGRLQFVDLPAAVAQGPQHVLVIFTDPPPAADTTLSGALLSEPALAEDWLRDEEAAAWAHLQPGR